MKEDTKVILGALAGVTIIFGIMGVSSYFTNEQTIRCVEAAKNDTIAMRCFN